MFARVLHFVTTNPRAGTRRGATVAQRMTLTNQDGAALVMRSEEKDPCFRAGLLHPFARQLLLQRNPTRQYLEGHRMFGTGMPKRRAIVFRDLAPAACLVLSSPLSRGLTPLGRVRRYSGEARYGPKS